MNKYEETGERALHWILYSGIRFDDPKDVLRFGGIRFAYDIAQGRYIEWERVEEAGYGMINFLKLYKETRNEEFLKVARDFGDWVTRMQYLGNDDGVNYGALFNRVKEGMVERLLDKSYTYDNCIALRGLLDLYEVTKEEHYARAAKAILHWLQNSAANSDGSYKLWRRIGVPNEYCVLSGADIQSAAIYALLKAYNVFNEPIFLNQAKISGDWIISRQRPDGSWATRGNSPYEVHFAFYSVEQGLLSLFEVTGEDRYLESAEKAINFLLKVQIGKGKWERYGGHGADHLLSDIQAVSTLTTLYKHTGKEGYLETAKIAADNVYEVQIKDSSNQLAFGGIPADAPDGPFANEVQSIPALWAIWVFRSCIFGKL